MHAPQNSKKSEEIRATYREETRRTRVLRFYVFALQCLPNPAVNVHAIGRGQVVQRGREVRESEKSVATTWGRRRGRCQCRYHRRRRRSWRKSKPEAGFAGTNGIGRHWAGVDLARIG